MGGTCKISQGSTQICHKNQLFTEEALCTALHQIGSLLSSGPFTSSSDDIRDYKYLIPNHFLIGKQSPNLSPGIFSDSEINQQSKWRSVQSAIQLFWKK